MSSRTPWQWYVTGAQLLYVRYFHFVLCHVSSEIRSHHGLTRIRVECTDINLPRSCRRLDNTKSYCGGLAIAEYFETVLCWDSRRFSYVGCQRRDARFSLWSSQPTPIFGGKGEADRRLYRACWCDVLSDSNVT